MCVSFLWFHWSSFDWERPYQSLIVFGSYVLSRCSWDHRGTEICRHRWRHHLLLSSVEILRRHGVDPRRSLHTPDPCWYLYFSPLWSIGYCSHSQSSNWELDEIANLFYHLGGTQCNLKFLVWGRYYLHGKSFGSLLENPLRLNEKIRNEDTVFFLDEDSKVFPSCFPLFHSELN